MVMRWKRVVMRCRRVVMVVEEGGDGGGRGW